MGVLPRGANVLFHSHINPYGLFPLDLRKRLGIIGDNAANNKQQIETTEDQAEDLVGMLYA